MASLTRNNGGAHTREGDAPAAAALDASPVAPPDAPAAAPLGTPPAPLPATPRRAGRRRRDRRARSDRAGVGQQRPIATGDMYIGTIDDLPQGKPLETALHVKRQRTLTFDDYQPSSSSSRSSGAASQPPVPVKPEPSRLAMSSRAASPLLVLVKPEPFWSPTSPGAASQPPVLVKPEPFGSTKAPESKLLESRSVPSPAEFYECESPRTRHLRRSLRDDEIGGHNLGSEEEEGDSGDEDESRQFIPRGLRMFVVADEDTEQEAEAAIMRNPSGVNEMNEMYVEWETNEMTAEGDMNEMTVEFGMNEMTVEGEMNEMTVEGEMNGPLLLFDFDWREFSNPPISPQLRREVFVGRHGPTTEPALTPYDAFVQIWDRPVMEEIACQTNIYAQQYAARLLDCGDMMPQSRIVDWRDTDVDELYIYFALVMAMAITVKSPLAHYWSADNNIFSTPGFSTHMPLRRFQLLSKCLHFTDNTNCPPNRTRSEAKISKIKPIVGHLNAKFQALYGLGQNIALDESLTQWKGWVDIKQYIPNKASTVGIKTYEVCDSLTGYLWRFEIHSGGESENPEASISGIVPNLVLRLLQGLDNRGHTVWMDNFYNSPALARILKAKGFDCVGTLRTNQQFVPDQITNLQKSDMRMGQVFGYTSGDVDVMVWRDQNRVGMISTYHGTAVCDSKPILIKDYNVCMGGVDKKDQMLSMYPMERKRTQVWYKKFFKRLLNVSILNAYIIYKHNHAQITHRAFRMELVLELLQRHQQRQVAPLATVRGVPKFSAEVQAHFPVELPQCPGDKHNKQRRLCVVCKAKRTHVVCNACNVALCFNLKSRSTCYMMYHT